MPAAEVAGKSIATLKNELAIDPILFNFELVCGQVVKVDPVTGVNQAVAGATVNVYDLVLSLALVLSARLAVVMGFPVSRTRSRN